MIAKMFEVRDKATFIPVLAVKLRPGNAADRFLLAQAGYGTHPEVQESYVVLSQVNGGDGKCTCDPFDWKDRTYQVAHDHIRKNFDALESGAVVDVEFILGESLTAKASEKIGFGNPMFDLCAFVRTTNDPRLKRWALEKIAEAVRLDPRDPEEVAAEIISRVMMVSAIVDSRMSQG